MTATAEGLHQLSVPDIERRVANMIRLGKITHVDLAAKRVRVQSGNLQSGWLPWPAGRAGQGKRRWDPPEVGEQVVMLSPSGDMTQAAIIPGLYQTSHDAPSADANQDLAEYSDGTVIGYNRSSHTLTIDLGDCSVVANRTQVVITVGGSVLTITGSGTTLETPALTVDAPNSTFTGNVSVGGQLTYSGGLAGSGGSGATITGNVTVNGNISNTGNITSGGSITDSNGDGGA